MKDHARIAVLVPCYNEEAAIERVVRDFHRVLPGATVYVYDNNSSDRTIDRAIAAGALIRGERLQGKGQVVRRMFADVNADIYVLVDGDGTYDPHSAPKMVEQVIAENLDMVTAARVCIDPAGYRRGHRLGNRMLTGLVSVVFNTKLNDMLSGFRVFSRRYVKSFPANSRGFEIETELTVHALELRMPMLEIHSPYGARLEGSASKLSTYKDGIRILKMILLLVKEERPFAFFSATAVILGVLAATLGLPIFTFWMETGLVPRLPTAILATGLVLLAFLNFMSGIVLESVALNRRENRRFAYLTIAPPSELQQQRSRAALYETPHVA